jgi:flagellar biosynthesis anti-sigma factor FlgM
MKIQPPPRDIPSSANSATGPDRSAPAPKPAQGGSTPDASTVKLSDLSSNLQASGGVVEFDRARVETIKQAIAQGQLDVNAEVVADKLIANALALSGKN